MHYVVAIDPGLSGAIALRASDGTTTCLDVPVHAVRINSKRRNRLDDTRLARLAREISVLPVALVITEPPVGRSKQSASAAAAFGDVAGALRLAIVTALYASGQRPRIHIAHSQAWKPKLRLPRDKDDARARAAELMPGSAHQWTRARDHNRAEAAALALYGATHILSGATYTKSRGVNPRATHIV